MILQHIRNNMFCYKTLQCLKQGLSGPGPPNAVFIRFICRGLHKECRKHDTIFQLPSNFLVNAGRQLMLYRCLSSVSNENPTDPKKKATESVPATPAAKPSRLLKVTSAKKKKSIDYSYVGNVFILPVRAMNEFLLSPNDLTQLPKYTRRSPYGREMPILMFLRSDIEKLAIKKWGSLSNVTKEKQKTPGPQPEKLWSSSSGKVVVSAIFINAINTLVKLIAWLYTGSHSMFSECIHSLADTVNQVILGIGLYHSIKKPDAVHPYGYRNLKNISSLISGVGIFCFGTGLSVYHGIQGLLHPQEMEYLGWAIAALLGTMVSEGATLIVAIAEVRKSSKAKNMKFWEYVTRGNDPNVNVVLLEDLAAVLGVGIAATCLTISQVTGSPFADAIGSLLVGGILGSVASFIIYSNIEVLVGKSIPLDKKLLISQELENDRMIRSLHDVKATEIGGEVRFKAEVDFDGMEITRAYLLKVDLENLLTEMQNLKKTDDAENFLLMHGERIIDTLGEEVDRIEKKLKTHYPDLRHVDLEAL
ncbi:zinc transporter 9 [Octopus bimaculoides]|nr:zinc transporter 9 [Octopus bimaculoides]